MRVVGIDLAAEARGTAVAVLDWREGRAVLSELECPADDEVVAGLCRDADRVGIDCPLGWPDPFVEFVTRHRQGAVSALEGARPGWRRALTNRLTDLACIEHTRSRTGRAVRPLSVSADLLGHAAMRCAVLLATLADAGLDIDRSGVDGRVAEVYPAAALALWEVEPRSYKGARRHLLPEVVDAFAARTADWLEFGAGLERCRGSDHCFDAVLAALAARAVALGRATAPEPHQRAVAAREGWIALPTCTLDELAGA